MSFAVILGEYGKQALYNTLQQVSDHTDTQNM